MLTIALRHTSFNSCLAELHRNPALCRLLEITTEDQIPNGWNLSRFLDVLGSEPHLSRLREVFDHLVRHLGKAVSDLGQHTAGDATSLCGRPKADAAAVNSSTVSRLDAAQAISGQSLPFPIFTAGEGHG